MAKYSIGIDFGSLSGRAVLVDVQSGGIAADADYAYPHAVMERALPDGTPVRSGWALQHPRDYEEVLYRTVPKLLERSGVDKKDVVGLGLDATACTILPLDKTGAPLCYREKYAGEPNAYIKMWKHHGAAARARRMTEIAAARGEKWLKGFGGHISGESLFPRLWELMDEAPELYEDMYEYAEIADYAVFLLTGVRCRNSCAAGYKAYYHKQTGYPDAEFLRAVAPGLGRAAREKLPSPVLPAGSRAGGLRAEMAEKLGLLPDMPVAVAHVDAHVGASAAGIVGPGELLMIIGTSTCDMLLGESDISVPGICGSVEDGIIPGFFGYEAGQSSVGDLFAHFVQNAVPLRCYEGAAALGIGIHEYLSRLAASQKPGECGLLALDWLNGNRSVLADFDLSTMVLGVTSRTRPEDIYRALIESTAFGARVIIDNYRAHGVAVDRLAATGGISQKNPFLMQLYANILEMPIRAVDTPVGPALGSAIFGALAAGRQGGGYESIGEAIRAMSGRDGALYLPDSTSFPVYRALYAEYRRLCEYFGSGENTVMKSLRHISQEAERTEGHA